MSVLRVLFTCLCCCVFVGSSDGFHSYRISNPAFIQRTSEAIPESVLTDLKQEQNSAELKSDIKKELLLNKIVRNCSNFHTCLQLDILSNISDIVKNDEYNLTKNIILEKFPDSEVKFAISESELEKLKNPGKIGFGFLPALVVKKTIDIFKSHSLKVKLLPGMDIRVFRNTELGGKLDIAFEETSRDPRTFGGPRKRIMMLLLPMIYKMGVMSTMLVGLIVLTLKGLTIGVILLILAFGNLVKKKGHGGYYHHPAPTDIHVHVHTDPHVKAYSGWQEESYSNHEEEYPHYRRRWRPPRPTWPPLVN